MSEKWKSSSTIDKYSMSSNPKKKFSLKKMKIFLELNAQNSRRGQNGLNRCGRLITPGPGVGAVSFQFSPVYNECTL